MVHLCRSFLYQGRRFANASRPAFYSGRSPKAVAATRFKPVVGRDPWSGLSYRLATADLPAVYATAHERTRFMNGAALRTRWGRKPGAPSQATRGGRSEAETNDPCALVTSGSGGVFKGKPSQSPGGAAGLLLGSAQCAMNTHRLLGSFLNPFAALTNAYR